MDFNKENIEKYNVMEVTSIFKCSICNKETNYVDYWSDNKFCSIECQEKYYSWIKKNKDLIV